MVACQVFSGVASVYRSRHCHPLRMSVAMGRLRGYPQPWVLPTASLSCSQRSWPAGGRGEGRGEGGGGGEIGARLGRSLAGGLAARFRCCRPRAPTTCRPVEPGERPSLPRSTLTQTQTRTRTQTQTHGDTQRERHRDTDTKTCAKSRKGTHGHTDTQAYTTDASLQADMRLAVTVARLEAEAGKPGTPAPSS